MYLHLATTGSRKVNFTKLNLGRLFFLFPLPKPVLACVVSVSALVFRLEKFGTKAKREMKGAVNPPYPLPPSSLFLLLSQISPVEKLARKRLLRRLETALIKEIEKITSPGSVLSDLSTSCCGQMQMHYG